MAALTDSMGNTINGSLQELRAAMFNNTNTIRYNTLGVNNSTTQTTTNTGELKKLALAMEGLKKVFENDFKQTLDNLNTAISSLGSSSSSSGTDVVDNLDIIYP